MKEKRINYKRIGIAGVILLAGIIVVLVAVQRNRKLDKEELTVGPFPEAFGGLTMAGSASETFYDTEDWISYGDRGYLKRNNRNILSFCDSNSGEEMVICNKAGCSHDPAGADEAKDCAAYIPDYQYAIGQGEYIYLLSNGQTDEENTDAEETDAQNIVIYRENADSSHRKQMLEIQDTANYVIEKIVCNENWMVVSYSVYQEEKELLYEYEGLLIVDIKNWTVRDLKEDYNMVAADGTSAKEDAKRTSMMPRVDIIDFTLDDNMLNFMYSYYDESYQEEEYAELSKKEQMAYQKKHLHGVSVMYSITEKRSLSQNSHEGIVTGIVAGSKIFYQNSRGDLYIEEAFSDEADKKKAKKKVYHGEIDWKWIEEGYMADSVKTEGVIGDIAYYSVYYAKKNQTIWYSYRISTNSSEVLYEWDKGRVAYMSQNCVYLEKCHDAGEISWYESICMSEEEFVGGDFIEEPSEVEKNEEEKFY